MNKLKIMKNTLAILLVLLFISCNNKPNTPAPIPSQDTLPHQVINKEVTKSEAISKDTFYQSEIMANRDILFNGKVGREFSLKDFKRVFVKPDSTRAVTTDDCEFSFGEVLGDEDNLRYAKYLYKDGSVFEKYKDEIVVKQFAFTKNNFILYKGIRIDASTTINDIEKLFPNAVKNFKRLAGEDNIYTYEECLISLREFEISDGSVDFHFKNNHAAYIYWEYLC